MAIVQFVEEAAATPEVQTVYDEIKKMFGVSFVPNIFKTMANNPEYLKTTWSRFKVIMGPGKLDPKTKQVIALAVSATNNCEYCVNAHSAMLKQMGYDDAALTELMAVVDMFNGFNKFLDGLRVESDLKP
jgi:AhpD family alkylhydroperoxidase